MEVKRENSSATLIIHRVSHETQGEYVCKAYNLAGKDEKIFQVYVKREWIESIFKNLIFSKIEVY